jgi:HAD superfamily hydrolase (TIGR01490 family)
MPIAFFDLDRTLLSVNSAQLWVRFEHNEGRISWFQALKAGLWIGAYHLGFARIEAVIEDAIATLAHQDEREVFERTRRFYQEQVQNTVRPGAIKALEQHRTAGDTLAILTSSSIYLSRLAGEQLNISHLCCNRFEVIDGRFTGKADGNLCFGAGKIQHAEALASSLGQQLKDASFYTDSASDIPVLERVGRPIAINPDPTLAREARRRGWEIIDWGS